MRDWRAWHRERDEAKAAVACPLAYCAAKPGDFCRGGNGHARKPHAVRVRAYHAAGDPPPPAAPAAQPRPAPRRRATTRDDGSSSDESMAGRQQAAIIVAELDAIESDPPPCLPVADCNCATCARYCALWDALDRVRPDHARGHLLRQRKRLHRAVGDPRAARCESCEQTAALARFSPAVTRLIGQMQDAGLSAVLQARVTARRCTCGRLRNVRLQIEGRTRPFVRMAPWRA